MRARIIEVNDKQIYLQVDEQLRFKTPYVSADGDKRLSRKDDIDFDFTQKDGRAFVVVRQVLKDHRKM
ncbi:MAG: hypothetical protein AB1644_07895 [Candidatus Zixiibacteriota bacterium]